MKRVAFAVLMAAAALVLRADQGINQKKGFNADNVYHTNDIDAINAFNHTQFLAIDTTARFDLATGAQVNPLFGSVTAARDARRIVMGLKLTF